MLYSPRCLQALQETAGGHGICFAPARSCSFFLLLLFRMDGGTGYGGHILRESL
jgi:hypothetical protein